MIKLQLTLTTTKDFLRTNFKTMMLKIHKGDTVITLSITHTSEKETQEYILS